MKYTSMDIEDLKVLYPRSSWDVIEKRFPGKSRRAIRILACKYDIKRESANKRAIVAKNQAPTLKMATTLANANMRGLYQLIIVTDDRARDIGMAYSRLRLIERAMQLVRAGV